jgi:hypothetical protein
MWLSEVTFLQPRGHLVGEGDQVVFLVGDRLGRQGLGKVPECRFHGL